MKKREHKIPNSIPSRKWRNIYQCRKGKGRHQFELIHARRFTFLEDEIYIDYKCSVCGKQKVVTIPID